MKTLGHSNPLIIENIGVQRRVVSIHMQNDVIGDRKFVPEVAQALREIAQALDDGLIGHETAEFLRSSGGTEITFHGDSLFMDACVVEQKAQSEENPPLLVFQVRSRDGRVINIYSNGFIDGDGTAEFGFVRNYFTPRFNAVRGLLARMEDRGIPDDELERIFAGF
ncbi:TPA: hypothetical protein PKO72_004323 [Aeromonas hydrophila]|uniref:hypothetical protein n=1 Tax=Aeromonas hydrophila TaxID=644 RepID=UPI0009863AA4|nr:hypothetical protein [Aeromonas hydrophila]EHK5438673.1 hypothetical protein [Aeromonas hydrophila]MBS4671229.1 hypothetical protein [Aeromonas hydrophila]OOD34869.1 hypothetical protein BWP11_06085 [Aeromonas hydrophila]UBQ50866.1 hypothetical protein LCH17_01685 [Aeromonas hydrophila]SUU26927.1 Uncharacterised protein [Aeromonas hydrophila]